VTLLADEFLLGKQVVGEDAVQFPDFIELIQLGSRVVAEVADEFADPGPVLLLHVGAIVLVPGPGAGERDLVGMAVGEQVFVDELRSVVRIDADNREREHRGDVLECLEDPPGGLVPHGPVHRPTGGNVGHCQGEAELTKAVAALMAHQVDFHETRDRVVPFGPGADRDLGLQ